MTLRSLGKTSSLNGRLGAIAAGLLLVFSLASGAAHAQFLEPGKRIKGHAKLDCKQCHTEAQGISRPKCLNCHDHQPLRARIRANKGLHAKKKYKQQGCEKCHSEHKGRNYNPIDWRPLGGMKRFDHGLTGYDLEGAHRRVDCKDCHTAKFKQSGRPKFLGLDSDCLSCHEDVHRFRKSHEELLDCKICHSQDARTVVRAKGLRFDHGKIADFALKGKHNETKCTNCHTSTKSFKLRERPERCADCHNDIHKNVYTTKARDCNACHSDSQRRFTAKIPAFNHGKVTRFKLKGKHKKQKCTECHAKTSKSAPEMSCRSCHLEDSAHVLGGKDRFDGRDCSQCHTERSYKKRKKFKHNELAGFALGGKHGKLDCKQCHRVKSKRAAKKPKDLFEFFPSGKCIGCHAHTNEHEGKFNDRPRLCVKCHVPGSTNIKNPDHSELSDTFAQQGAHAPIACDKCHGNALSNLSPGKDCSACHADDDHHEGNLGTTCKNCHLEGFPWSNVIFNHNKHSEFPLEGKHQAVACTKCHSNAPKTYKPQEQDCISCHREQDVHKEALGTDCGKCHDAHGTTANFDHNTMTEYPLEGAHARADCRGCHFEGETAKNSALDLTFGAQGSACRDCHGDPHGLRPGAQCQGCHDTEDFNNASSQLGGGDDDGKKADPADAGVPNPDGGPTEQAMFEGADHGITPPPASSLKFASQRDRYHDLPPFSLRDGHAKVDCTRCHGGRGDLQGFGKLCDTCHKQDDIHAGSLGPTCANCHTQRAFAPSFFTHSSTAFPLVASHRVVSCKQCHGAGNYMGLSGDCVSCHLDDAYRAGTTSIDHTGYISTPCIGCHNQVSWVRSPMIRRRF